jgi:hypothetical protein
MATGIFGVVAVQEVKDATVGVTGVSVLVVVVLELPPPQATRINGSAVNNISLIITPLIRKSYSELIYYHQKK